MFELFDLKTRNVAGFFEDQEAALAFARRWPVPEWSRFVLGYSDDDTAYHVIAKGDRLRSRLSSVLMTTQHWAPAALISYGEPDSMPITWLLGVISGEASQLAPRPNSAEGSAIWDRTSDTIENQAQALGTA